MAAARGTPARAAKAGGAREAPETGRSAAGHPDLGRRTLKDDGEAGFDERAADPARPGHCRDEHEGIGRRRGPRGGTERGRS